MFLVETTLLRHAGPGCLTDGKRESNPSFPKFSISTVLVDLLPEHIQQHVFVVPILYTPVGVILLLMGLFPCRKAGVGVGGRGIVKLSI